MLNIMSINLDSLSLALGLLIGGEIYLFFLIVVEEFIFLSDMDIWQNNQLSTLIYKDINV